MDPSAHRLRIPLLAIRSALPAVIVVGAVAFLSGAAAWTIAAAHLMPTSVIIVWAMRGLASAAGLAVPLGSAVLSLPPTLANLALFFAIYWSGARLRRMLEAEDAEDGTEGRDRLRAQIIGAASVFGIFAVLVIIAAIIGGAAADLRGIIRVVVLVSVPVLVSLRPAGELINQAVRDYMGSAALEALRMSRGQTLRVFAALAISSNVVLAVLIAIRFSEVTAVLDAYSSPAAAAVGLGVIQLAYAPTIWAAGIAWVSGAGVTLARGVELSAYRGAEGIVPPFPIAYVFPPDPSPWAGLLVLIPVAAVAAAVIGRSAWQSAAQLWPAVFSSVQILIGFAVLCLFFSGGIGGGGLSEVGVDVVPMMFLAGLGTCAVVFAGTGMVWLRDRYSEAE